jgi:hypothetical protein
VPSQLLIQCVPASCPGTKLTAAWKLTTYVYSVPTLRESAVGMPDLVLCAFIVLTENDFHFRYYYCSVFSRNLVQSIPRVSRISVPYNQVIFLTAENFLRQIPFRVLSLVGM